jgi:hypothetical protein
MVRTVTENYATRSSSPVMGMKGNERSLAGDEN